MSSEHGRISALMSSWKLKSPAQNPKQDESSEHFSKEGRRPLEPPFLAEVLLTVDGFWARKPQLSLRVYSPWWVDYIQ